MKFPLRFLASRWARAWLSLPPRPPGRKVSVGVNIGLPAWGPPVPQGTQYYYIPEIDGYYDIYNGIYLVFDGYQWVQQPYLDGYDPYYFHPYPVSYVGPQPWLYISSYRSRYPQYVTGYRRGGYGNYGRAYSHDYGAGRVYGYDHGGYNGRGNYGGNYSNGNGRGNYGGYNNGNNGRGNYNGAGVILTALPPVAAPAIRAAASPRVALAMPGAGSRAGATQVGKPALAEVALVVGSQAAAPVGKMAPVGRALGAGSRAVAPADRPARRRALGGFGGGNPGGGQRGGDSRGGEGGGRHGGR